MRSIGSCVAFDAPGTVVCPGEQCDSLFQCRYQKQVFLQVDDYISQVTVDHGFQLWDFWSRSPYCEVVSVAFPIERISLPWHIRYVIVEQ